ncbi:MAG TPA: hypothetical protein VGS21_07885 [Acidimicrobiales bacterium]|nr:hypothetical protein [Acidimicrobiales bacterium]
MIFVEGLRLLIVLAGVLAGLGATDSARQGSAEHFIGATIGALVGYVAGGILGRILRRGVSKAAGTAQDIPAVELIPGAILGTLIAILAVLACIPLFVFVHSAVDYPATAAIAFILGSIGVELGMSKGSQLVDSLGLTRRLSGRNIRVPDNALLIDSSALMDRSLLALGRAGLLPKDILVPEFVVDMVTTMTEAPDHVTSRRARRGLEAVDALRQMGHSISIVPGDVPSVETPDAKVAILAGQLGVRVATCSGAVVASRDELALPVLDLRRLAGELTPDHVPGDALRIDLVRAGRQPKQAIGYLPDGDMVVVNDADHAIGEKNVEVEVLSTRQTSQGLLVFARLADDDREVTADPEPSLRR